ncbi:hypothetical protein [Methylobacterium sp. PvR107]|uniref:hypothetical protein n=1 Tax=Methylobacterium sp. PvR107 TaxID=2806597 RepID=UPI001AE9B141|nr:hypothetical protein [Methylobacterium sp. PvR107]MBP1182603.1 hypothetical protein [Methylobacterium sp. PvR107]
MTAPAQTITRALPRLDSRIVLWVVIALCVVTMSTPQAVWDTIQHLRVPDTDDAMRLVEVRDLLSGQGWYDNVQSRFLPPAGVLSHWSRLVDAPIAGMILALSPIAGPALAEGLTAALWPLLLFGLYGWVLYRGVRHSFGERAALLAVLVATQTFGVTTQFQPGRVDHHNVQMIALLGLAACMIRGGFRSGLIGGGSAALSLAIGLEGLPSVAVATLYLVGDWCLRGRPARPTLSGFGFGLGAAAPVLFAAQTAPDQWAVPRCDALSPPWLFLASAGLIFVLGATWAGDRLATIRARAALAGLCGAVMLAAFAAAFPACLGGPFPGMPALVRDHWLLTVNEMASVPKLIAGGQWEALAFHPVVALASLTAAWLAWRGLQRRAWTVAALFLWPGLILGVFQFRGLYIASGFVPLVAGAVLDRALTQAEESGTGARRWGFALLGGSMVSTLWMAPALLGEVLLPASRTAPDPGGAAACQSDTALRPLAALPPGTILAPIFLGPSILLRTPHSVVAAPYHRAISGLEAAIEGLGGTEADLDRVLTALRIRYLVACPARPADDLQAEPAFATRLARGAAESARLAPVALPGPLKVWRVTR